MEWFSEFIIDGDRYRNDDVAPARARTDHQQKDGLLLPADCHLQGQLLRFPEIAVANQDVTGPNPFRQYIAADDCVFSLRSVINIFGIALCRCLCDEEIHRA
ncbi:hypothetical protein BFX06_07750 [Sulfobacillus thermosulfidooxidans]|nr:hypothetical protein BFX05_01980 [Sulfobacillus thermosulfidooxidans]OLZ14178.1 hypothetical protein BFX06_07750 [Sulfobacillus thermosulfidooxidans]OLZ18921.1 hypothetical protein BFX07_04145 [Sulfobacillus thermosulfidooxidans]